MSRRHLANVRGVMQVELVCDECDKREWAAVLITDCDACPEYEAVRASDTWAFAEDSLVCSEACEARFWADELSIIPTTRG